MSDLLNFQIPVGGFGSYVQNILPSDQAVLAGAFSTSMLQINGIQNVNLQRFAQVVFSCETTLDLPLISGTNVPTDQLSAASALGVIALGGGPYGTYTMSNFFGAMSGLPYPLQAVHDGIQQLQTDKLANIYIQLYLAVSWQQATATATITFSGGNYSLTGFTINNPSGGYGRGTAPAPTVTVTGSNSFSATATAVIGDDPTDLSTYGKITGFTITNPGTQAGNPGTTTTHIQAPPTATLPVNSDGSFNTGGTNTAYGTTGWTGAGIGMDSVVQAYIDQANAEIIAISTSTIDNFNAANTLNTNYNAIGTALKQEQRARYNALPPVPVPYNNYTSSYPGAIYMFANFLPVFANDTAPNMSVQTLENISDINLTGGQSIIGAMREQRNQARLLQVGIPLQNYIPNGLTQQQLASLYVNGTLPNAVDGIPNPGTGTQSTFTAYPNQPTSPSPAAQINTSVATAVNGLVIPNTATPLPILNNNRTGLAALNTVPLNINAAYTSSTLSPASFNTSAAIQHVVTCNCDCWLS